MKNLVEKIKRIKNQYSTEIMELEARVIDLKCARERDIYNDIKSLESALIAFVKENQPDVISHYWNEEYQEPKFKASWMLKNVEIDYFCGCEWSADIKVYDLHFSSTNRDLISALKDWHNTHSR